MVTCCCYRISRMLTQFVLLWAWNIDKTLRHNDINMINLQIFLLSFRVRDITYISISYDQTVRYMVKCQVLIDFKLTVHKQLYPCTVLMVLLVLWFVVLTWSESLSCACTISLNFHKNNSQLAHPGTDNFCSFTYSRLCRDVILLKT